MSKYINTLKKALTWVKIKLHRQFFNDIEKRFKKISFSQSGEDVIIKFIFNNLKIKNPSYIDIGAHHPFHINNTAIFYENGSTGINIEPDPHLFKEIKRYRKKDINLNIGIGPIKKLQDFFIISASTLNTFSKEEAEKYSQQGNFKIDKVIKVQVNTLSNVLEKYNEGKFPDFLNIDAEGVDEIIIREIDFTKSYPIVICIETLSFSTKGMGAKNLNLINFIKSKGYILYADTNINSIFVRKEYWERN